MGNMSYCRFRNTLADVRACVDAMDEPLKDDDESAARLELIRLCVMVADVYGREVNRGAVA